MVSVSLVSIIVPSDDPNLLRGSGAAASPFVIAIQSSGIKGIPDLVNACIIVGIMSVALESIYLPSRMLRTMALQGLIPEFMAKVDEKGRPRWALAITAVVGTALTYMNLSGTSSCYVSAVVSANGISSQGSGGAKLANRYYQRLILRKLGHRCIYLDSFQGGSQSSEQRHLQRCLCLEHLSLASGTGDFSDDLHPAAGVFTLFKHRAVSKFVP